MGNDSKINTTHMETTEHAETNVTSKHIPHPKGKVRHKEPHVTETNITNKCMDQGHRQANIREAPSPHRGKENNIAKPGRLPKTPFLHDISLRHGTAHTDTETK